MADIEFELNKSRRHLMTQLSSKIEKNRNVFREKYLHKIAVEMVQTETNAFGKQNKKPSTIGMTLQE